MKSINDNDYLENYNVSDQTVGIVGFGYVGQAIESFLSSECKTVVYDKDSVRTKKYDLNTLEDVVSQSHVIFVCVPTPMNKDGSCYTGIVENVLENIKMTCEKVNRDVNEFVVVVKSTVYPGFTAKVREEKQMRVVFSPEFLTEANSIADFENTNRILVGGDATDCEIVLRLFHRKLEKKAVLAYDTDSTAVEMVKLYTNAMLMTKVVFANEMYKVCKALNVEYKDVMLLTCLDSRIARSHLMVPGPDGDFGAGGHCFPKDINNLKNVAKQLETGERLFSAVIDRNNEVRTNRDWEKMSGRAVVNEEQEKNNK